MRPNLVGCCYRIFCAIVPALLLAGAAAHAQSGLDERPSNPTCVAPERPGGGSLLGVEVVASQDISWPVEMLQHPADSSTWYVVDRSGYVAIYKDGPTFTRAGTLIDISNIVQREFDGRDWAEMGLLGMTLHPNFADNGEFFL
ncbi:MAG: hypothetical protein JJ992_07810, partial [Planctomycetes bacterium]|nr:hypothetical protein [Planctomycetota bacterium]